jgi:SpoVK/Ycf46/Vps4 family AAA+-type ATPase
MSVAFTAGSTNPTMTASMTAQVRHLQTLITSFHPLIAIETVEEERVQNLLQGATQEMNLPMMEWSASHGLIRSTASADNRWQQNCAPGTNRMAYDGTEDPSQVLKQIKDLNLKAIFWLKDFSVYLEDPTIARQFRELVQSFSESRSALVISGVQMNLPPSISHDAVYLDLKLPGREELTQAVQAVMRSLRSKSRVQVELQDADIPALVQALTGMTLNQARQVLAYAAMEDGKLTLEDIDSIVKRKAQVIREDSVLEYSPADHTPLQLGGFNGLKQWLSRAQLGFTPQAQALNLAPPKGILIVGIQGCGKSMSVKSIAKAWRMPLLKLEAGRIYDKHVGESERNFRNALNMAESMSPAVLWIDEIEKAFGQSESDADGGLSRRLFGSFLTWMQEKSQSVFVIATANDLSRIPPELLRKGRFDEIFFVDLPDPQERSSVWQIHLTKRKQNPAAFDMAKLVMATEGYSGAEIEQVIISALYAALYQQQPLTTELLVNEVRSTVPLSVSRREDVEHLRAIAKERFVSVR